MIQIAWICPNAAERERLLNEFKRAGSRKVVVVGEDYPQSWNEPLSLRLKLAEPQVVIVDTENHARALECLRFLGELLPKATLIALAATEDPSAIIETMQAGAREYVRKEQMADLSAALLRVEAKRRRNGSGHRRCRIYSVAGAKGGVGTTTVAINLAGALAAHDDTRVGLLDMAWPLGDLAPRFDLAPAFGLEDALAAGDRLDAALLESFTVTINNVGLLSGWKRLGADRAQSAENLNHLFTVAEALYDYIVVDVSSFLDVPGAETVFNLSEKIAVILTAELPVLWRAKRALEYLESLGVGEKQISIVNRWHRSDLIGDAEIEEALKTTLFGRLPNDYSNLVKGINKGEPFASSNRTEFGNSIKELTAQLLGTPKPEKRRGVLSLLG